jgi:2-succinyl-5-enolpyruvyl-6-hydroxy-3-cyclohexene-1-carboxylate synthase
MTIKQTDSFNDLVSPAQIFSAHIIAELAAWGRDFWLAPGARSQALAIAAAQVTDAGRANLHVRIDERSLGFNALGAAVYGGPQAIITTSGTAVANLHPAVLEAHHSGLGLILLTADRPAELRDKGANQTTNQVGIFSDAVIECIDVPAPTEKDIPNLPRLAKELVEKAVLLAWGERPQPVQLNLQFIEPLSAITPNAAEILDGMEDADYKEEPAIDLGTESFSLDLEMPTVVVAGANAGIHINEIRSLGLPVFAEPTSGVRHLPESVLSYRSVLGNDLELAGQIKQVIVYGKPTLSRTVVSLLKRHDVKVFVREGQMGSFEIGNDVTKVKSPIVGQGGSEWLNTWLQKSAKDVKLLQGELDRQAIIVKTWEASSAAENILVLGASQLIREADFYAPGVEVRAWANRGLSGIDGTIATATGIAIQEPEKQVRALMGDLTFLHDVGSLALDANDGPLNIQVIVVNDNGGKIFSNLEVADSVEPDTFKRIFQTPQTADISKLAQAYGWQYVNPKTISDYELALEIKGRVIIEVQLD